MSKSSHQEGIIKRYYQNRDTIALQKLGEIASDLFLCEDPKKAAKMWERVDKALKHTDASEQEQARINQILSGRDVGGLCKLVNELASPQRAGGKSEAASGASTAAAAPTRPAATPLPPSGGIKKSVAGGQSVDETDPLVLKKAMKAFRKRLKLTKLDEESKLGVGPFSGGHKSQVVAIIPPDSFPRTVWDKLVEQGRLKNTGRGFYELAEG